jgi:hypothetical protein
MKTLSVLVCFLAFQAHAGIILKGGTSGSVTNCTTGNANQQAACLTATYAQVCNAQTIGDFYAEIGNASGILFSYQRGTSINRYTLMQLDSFTKFVDGAYWTQIRGGVNSLTADDILHLHQQSGYVNMPASCPANSSVIGCATQVPGANNILTLGTITNGGAGYPSGTHYRVPLTGGTGSGAAATLTISSGAVTSVALSAAGSGYLVGDSLSSTLSGGSGLAVPVTNTTCYPATSYTFAGLSFAANSYGGLCNTDEYVFYYNGANFQTHAIFDGGSPFYSLTRSGISNAFNTTLGTPTLTGSVTSGNATITLGSSYNWAPGMHVSLSGNIPTGFYGFTATNIVYYVTNVTQAPTTTTIQLSTQRCNPTCQPAVVPSSTTSGIVVTVMPITFSMPLMAGGGNWSAGGMAAFLTNILNASLSFGGALGTYEVTPNYLGNGEPTGGTDGTYCAYSGYAAQVLHGTVFGSPTAATTVICGGGGTTLTAIGATGTPGPWISNGISQALGSPIPANYKYGVAHWVVSDPVVNGDGAFAGIGASGVDGWIDSSKTYYGMLVRTGSPGSGYTSNVCDNLIRYAYLNAAQQTGPYPP